LAECGAQLFTLADDNVGNSSPKGALDVDDDANDDDGFQDSSTAPSGVLPAAAAAPSPPPPGATGGVTRARAAAVSKNRVLCDLCHTRAVKARFTNSGVTRLLCKECVLSECARHNAAGASAPDTDAPASPDDDDEVDENDAVLN
jgi:hypothetical protein